MRRQKNGGDDLLKSLPVGGVGHAAPRDEKRTRMSWEMNDGSRGDQGLGLSGVSPVSPYRLRCQ